MMQTAPESHKRYNGARRCGSLYKKDKFSAAAQTQSARGYCCAEQMADSSTTRGSRMQTLQSE